jgi:hypothetical protein
VILAKWRLAPLLQSTSAVCCVTRLSHTTTVPSSHADMKIDAIRNVVKKELEHRIGFFFFEPDNFACNFEENSVDFRS